MALIAVLVLLFQSQVFPPPFPRDGATKVFENARVIVWDVAWLKQPYPVHRHVYDYAGVYYSNGARIVISDQGRRSPTTSVAWDTFFFRRGVTHSEEGASDVPLQAVFVEFKEAEPLGKLDANTTAPAFPAGAGKQIRESERVVIWEFVPASALSTRSEHFHARDAIIVAFSSLKPLVTFVPRNTIHSDEQTGGTDRAYVFELK
jgi:hypothetical protein